MVAPLILKIVAFSLAKKVVVFLVAKLYGFPRLYRRASEFNRYINRDNPKRREKFQNRLQFLFRLPSHIYQTVQHWRGVQPPQGPPSSAAGHSHGTTSSHSQHKQVREIHTRSGALRVISSLNVPNPSSRLSGFGSISQSIRSHLLGLGGGSRSSRTRPFSVSCTLPFGVSSLISPKKESESFQPVGLVSQLSLRSVLLLRCSLAYWSPFRTSTMLPAALVVLACCQVSLRCGSCSGAPRRARRPRLLPTLPPLRLLLRYSPPRSSSSPVADSSSVAAPAPVLPRLLVAIPYSCGAPRRSRRPRLLAALLPLRLLLRCSPAYWFFFQFLILFTFALAASYFSSLLYSVFHLLVRFSVTHCFEFLHLMLLISV